MKTETLLNDGARPSVRLERHLPDPPSSVWQAITDRERLRSWFPCDVVVAGGEWKLAADITFTFQPEVIDMTLTGEVLTVDEPSVLAFTWGRRSCDSSCPRLRRAPVCSSSTSCRRASPPEAPQAGSCVSIAWQDSTPVRTRGERGSMPMWPSSNRSWVHRRDRLPATGADQRARGATACLALP